MFDFRATFKGRSRRRLAPGGLHSLAGRFPLLRSFEVVCMFVMRELYMGMVGFVNCNGYGCSTTDDEPVDG